MKQLLLWPLILPCAMFLNISCRTGPDPSGAGPEQIPQGNQYARRFTISEFEAYSLLKVRDPWQGSREVSYTYLLAKDPARIPDTLTHLTIIPIPVERVITLSTTHVAMITALEHQKSIMGHSGTSFLYQEDLRSRVESGDMAEVGHGQALDYERLVALEPDVVFMFGVEGAEVSAVAKMRELGLEVVYCADYLEAHPLGKAEWVRFFAAFYGEDTAADRIFDEVKNHYVELQSLAVGLKDQPAVLTGLPWKDNWYMAGGESFAARLISDAGGRYLWEDLPGDEARALDLESVYERAVEAEVWINPGVAGGLADLSAFDPRFEALPVLGSGRIYNNNARVNEAGGNDYWESATLRADLVLADLIAIFHPELLPDHSLYYYTKLK
jgi:iron complex transport system substrate-binding protein